MKEKVWTCSVGPAKATQVPPDGDLPMREAVRRAFVEITGHEPEYLFTGWGGEFSPSEREYIESHRA